MVVARPVGTAELAVIRPSLRDLLADVLRSILPSSDAPTGQQLAGLVILVCNNEGSRPRLPTAAALRLNHPAALTWRR